jgi:hypothetical protein
VIREAEVKMKIPTEKTIVTTLDSLHHYQEYLVEKACSENMLDETKLAYLQDLKNARETYDYFIKLLNEVEREIQEELHWS